MEDLILPVNAKTTTISLVKGPYFLNRMGTLSRLIETNADRGAADAFIDFGEEIKGVFEEFKWRGATANCIDLPVDRVDVLCRGLTECAARDLSIGSLYLSDAGFFLVAKSWNDIEKKMYVNLATGEFQTYSAHAEVMATDRFAISGWRDEQIVFNFSSPGYDAPNTK